MVCWTIKCSRWLRWGIFGMVLLILDIIAILQLTAIDFNSVDLARLNGKTVVIDSGHGGIDSGAQRQGIDEKTITLAISQKIAALLRENGSTVVMTREEDIDYYTRGKGGKRNDLLYRSQVIDASKADFFVSIHCNATNRGDLFGAQVFYNPKLEQNKQLAEALQYALKNFSPGNKREVKQDLHILLLNATNIPGVLIETGYLTNQREAALLNDPAYQQKMAEQIVKGLAYYVSQKVER